MHSARKKRISLIILISLVFFCFPGAVQADSGISQEIIRTSAYAIASEGEYIYILGEAVNYQGETDLDLRGGLKDIWLVKLNMDGTPVFTALIGGSNDDAAYDIAVREGVVYILGETWSRDFPGAPGNAGESDAVLLALASDGSGILWARRFGGSDQDAGRALTLYDGSLYLTGITWSEDLDSGGGLGNADGFLARVGLNGSLDWMSIFGGNALDAPYALTVGDDAIWVAGQSYSRNFGGSHQGEGDIFTARFSLGGQVQFSRLYGGREADIAFAIAPGDGGDILVAGGTRTGELPEAVGDYSGNYDGFLMSIDPDGDVVWTSYLGGTGVDYAYEIEVLPDGNVFVVGETYSPAFPLSFAQPQDAVGGGDAFVVQVNLEGEIVRGLLKGGPGGDYARDALLTSSGLWLAGKFDVGSLPYGLLISPTELGLADLPTEEPAAPTATLALTATPHPTETPQPTPTATERPANPQTATANAGGTATAEVSQPGETEILDSTATPSDVPGQASGVAELSATLTAEGVQAGQADVEETPASQTEQSGRRITGWVVGGAILAAIGLGGAYYWYHHKKHGNA